MTEPTTKRARRVELPITASYEAQPTHDDDGVPICRDNCPAFATVSVNVADWSGGSGMQPRLSVARVCCITKTETDAGRQCRPVLLATLRAAKEAG